MIREKFQLKTEKVLGLLLLLPHSIVAVIDFRLLPPIWIKT